MDILAHTLWTSAAAKGGNKISENKHGRFHVNVGWAAFWGVFPDFFAFTIPFVAAIANVLFNGVPFSALGTHAGVGSFDLAHYLYQYSHSLVIWAFVFLMAWAFSRRPRWELLGWALHILIDIPSHSLAFYPTPFLWPLSNYHYPYGVPWSNHWYMLINYCALALVWGGILWKKYAKKK